MGRRLVIDTSVTRAAGGEGATKTVSVNCREFLKAVLSICHKIVMTPAIQSEWRRHRSRYSSTWLASMDARKKVARTQEADSSAIQERISRLSQGNDRDSMIKDLPLIAAARATDGLVVSMDEGVRELFANISPHIGELRGIVWVNPTDPDDRALEWLQDGDPSDVGRQLGQALEE